ncbi:hypothetical protein RRG08_015182 [Elysia crispata]|uniref:Uncharacterized protein n=1 Tax=Elysia crispata TaxID=231223 RepID=A0AAE0YHW9_9GAST|nr:hypothetical protein RRG08_015182 [Elysia crispata]
MNELTCHMLEVIHASASGQAAGEERGKGEVVPAILCKKKRKREVYSQFAFAYASLQVQKIIRSDQSEQGCSVDEICQQLRSVAPKAIRDTIEF